jgi:hypothetical protein
MKRSLAVALLAAVPVVGYVYAAAPEAKPYPTPNIYPLSWSLKFQHSIPQRIVMPAVGQASPKAFWYITYTVTNKTDREQMWLPTFEFMTEEGKVIQSDGKTIPGKVFEAIKEREKKTFLEPANKVSGTLRIGDAEAKESAAIWEEPEAELGHFSIFVSGLSGEVRQFKKVDGNLVELKTGAEFKEAGDNLVILRKTLQLNFLIDGDDVYPGQDVVNEKAEEWVMR